MAIVSEVVGHGFFPSTQNVDIEFSDHPELSFTYVHSDCFLGSQTQQSQQHIPSNTHEEGCEGMTMHNAMASRQSLNLFGDPSQWWDDRSSKNNLPHPGFPRAQETLWVDGLWNQSADTIDFLDLKQDYREAHPANPRDYSSNCEPSIASSFRMPENGGNAVFSISQDGLSQLCDEGPLTDAIWALNLMHQKGICVCSSIFVCLLQRCIAENDLIAGLEVHNIIIRSGYGRDSLLGSHLIRMYASFKSLSEANQVFNKLATPNVYSWSAIISAHGKLGQNYQAINLYQQMQWSNVPPDGHVFVSVLKACSDIAALEHGKRVHAHIKASGLESDTFVGSALVNMYSKCGSLDDACEVFSKLPKRNVVTWNALIAGHVEHGRCLQAFQLFQNMQHEGIQPHRATFFCILKACSSIAAVEQGKWIHTYIIGSGFESDVMVGSTLIDMYCKCGILREARAMFDRLPLRDVFTWSALIGGYAQHGYGPDALSCFWQLQQEGLEPDEVTFVCTLKACASIADLEQGTSIQSHIIESGFESDLFVSSALIDMFSKCGSIEDACSVFDRMPKRGVVTWNALITGYTQNGLGEKSLEVFQKMKCGGIEPNLVTAICVLKACSSIAALGQGKEAHAEIVECGLQLNIVIGNSLIEMYGKLGSLLDAQLMFDRLPKRDAVTWSALIAVYTEHGHCQKAFQLFQELQQDGKEPNQVTFICILQACSNSVGLEQGKGIHPFLIQSGYEFDTSIGNTLIDMYGKSGSLEDARMVFERMPKRDVVTWNVLIAGYNKDGHGEEALQLFQLMQYEGIEPDQVTFICVIKSCSSVGALNHGRQIHTQINNSGFELDILINNTLIGMYGKCGSLKDALTAFDRVQNRNVVTWNALIAECAQHCDYPLAVKIFHDMQRSGLIPNSVTFLCILSACSHVGLLGEGCLHFRSMQDIYGIEPALEHYNSMIDLLGHAGSLNGAEDLLETMPFRSNIVGWTSLLNSCRRHANVNLGRRCFNHVVSMDSRKATAYVVMSNIFAHAGMQEDAKRVEQLRRSCNVWKKPARAFIEINNQVHSFNVNDRKHPQSGDIYAKLRMLSLQMSDEGYIPSLDFFQDTVTDEGKEDALCGHCERLAIALGLISTPQGSTIRVTKNLKVCANCHTAIKIVSKIEMREIVVVDAYCVHQFKDGSCSCRDYY